ncbi:MAG: hypothetical protein A2166_04760 [Omnitrophica WOR_2 bacterium RBG_13_41_10]|nr:MAG: hypothetical protein A2166_04760 [Omnitrophica WOR_2 bacterium RBG_13_41_10]
MFKVNELVEAAKGRLCGGEKQTSVAGISIDSRTIKAGEAFLAIKGENFDGHDFIAEAVNRKASCLVVSERSRIKYLKNKLNRLSIIEVKDTIKALGDIAGYQRRKFNIPVIAVTGSNGKTTTKEMISWVLAKRYKVLKNEGTKNNQIGLPMALLNLKSHHQIAVLEIGTNHFGEVGILSKICSPNIGIITNIGSSHLEFLRNLKGVFREKYALIENLIQPHIAILNADDNLLMKILNQKKTKQFFMGFGIKERCDFTASKVQFNWQAKKWSMPRANFSLNDKKIFYLKTLGLHNIYNALAAITTARIFGMGYGEIARGLASFEFLKMRLKFREFNKIKFIDDSYNSNPVSLRCTLEVLKNIKTEGRKIFVMGDMYELGKNQALFHCQAGRLAAGICNTLITVGESSLLAAQAAKKLGFKKSNIYTCESSSDAKNILFTKISLKKDDVVLVKGSRLMKMEKIFQV